MPMRIAMRCVVGLAALLSVAGCAQTRKLTISAKPADAEIKVDGVNRGRGPITESLVFTAKEDVHRITVSRLGYRDQTVQVMRDDKRESLTIDLKPMTRRVNVIVQPVAAVISIDGQETGPEPTTVFSRELEFSVDSKNNWIPHTVTAARPGFQGAQATINFGDRDPNYTLVLEPMRKSLTVNTTPTGAQVWLEGQSIGTSPVRVNDHAFPVDAETNQGIPQKLRVAKPGYDPVEIDITWDDGRTEYQVDLAAKTKIVRILTDPPGATIRLDGRELPRDANGTASVSLQFPPMNEKGDLRTYSGSAVKKTADSEWEPAKFTVAWDAGKSEYMVVLKEILTRPLPLLTLSMNRTDDGWQAVPQEVTTIACKDVTEPRGESPVQLTRLPKGTSVDSLVVSPDGSRLLFTILMGKDRSDFRSQMYMIQTDGTGGANLFSDGKSLDIMPSFSPAGDQILFASNRAGKRLNIWTMSAGGAPGITRLTTGDSNDLWPSLDSDPKPRLFYQAMIDTRPDPRVYNTQVGTIFQTDLTQLAGTQPRVSPKNDAVLFEVVNEKTGKRDICRMSDRGGEVVNLTNTPDVDEFDAVWS
ncbi:MAG: PEGA domain-containing protein, partial [Tepidisphaeraceae bacterium]